MGDLSPHFNRREFACKCGCGMSNINLQLVERLETIRGYFNAPVTINSACRCPAHNKKVGGAPNSQHMQGIAADIVVKGVPPAEVAKFAEAFWMSGGVGRYKTFTHVDVRMGCARWKG